MESMGTWRQLPPGNGERLILAVDFDTTGRPEANFTDLAKQLGPEYTLWETRPLQGEGFDGESHVRRWAEEIVASGRPVHAVLGFCAGAAFAPSLARQVSTGQVGPASLVLFDPEIVTPDTLYWQYSKIVGIASSALTPEERERALEAGREAHARSNGLAELGGEIRLALGQHVSVALQRLGLDEKRSAELLDAFDGFVDYLCAAGTLEPIQDWRTALVLTSSSETSGLNRLRSTDPTIGDDIAAREIHVDVPHAGLLRSNEAADAVRETLGAVR